MDFFDLSGKVALITGGNGGIGLAYAKGLVKAGAKVAIWGRNTMKNDEAVKELENLGGDVRAFVCDITDNEQVDKTFQSTIDHFGKVDICFANAGGGGPRGMLHQLSEKDWKGVLDLNLNSVVYTYQKVIAGLIKRKAPGKLVVTSSIASIMGMGFATGYSATKAAVVGLTKALAVELGQSNIQVNAILPGFIETDLNRNVPQHFKDAVIRRAVTGKMGTLDQMEGAAVFLASAASDFITGQSIIMDGGHTVHPM